jgi:hypothetical protein
MVHCGGGRLARRGAAEGGRLPHCWATQGWAFHDGLISHGSPVSVLEWIMLDDPTDLEKATGLTLH